MTFISPVGAQLGGYAFESLLYGCFIVYYLQCIQCLLRGHQPKSQVLINRFMGTAASLLFVFISAHWIINTVRLGIAFVEYGSIERSGPLEHYLTRLGREDKDCTVFIVQDTLWISAALVGDSILIYRLYSIWQSSWRVAAFPFVLLFVELAAAVAAAILNSETNTLTIWTLIAFVLNVTINLYCTSLIIHHMWRSSAVLNRYDMAPTCKTRTVSKILIESAGIYAIANIAFLITFATNSNLQFFLTDPASPAIGLVFCAIIVRARQEPPAPPRDEESRLGFRHQAEPKSRAATPAVDEVFVHISREVVLSAPDSEYHRSATMGKNHLKRPSYYDYSFSSPSSLAGSPVRTAFGCSSLSSSSLRPAS